MASNEASVDRPRRWKSVLGGLVAALFLMPVPAFAALNGLGPWAFGLNGVANPADNPFGWNPPVGSGTNGLTLDFFPKANTVPLAAAKTVSFTSAIAANSNSITATFSGWNILRMTAGSVTIDVQAYSLTNGSNADINQNNMFNGTVSANLGGATNLGLVVGNRQVVNIIFTFAAGSTWTINTSSSAHTVFQ